ncbi:MAG: hypothetical protein MHM6MM_003991 [Cercozoa sp. M6MM]
MLLARRLCARAQLRQRFRYAIAGTVNIHADDPDTELSNDAAVTADEPIKTKFDQIQSEFDETEARIQVVESLVSPDRWKKQTHEEDQKQDKAELLEELRDLQRLSDEASLDARLHVLSCTLLVRGAIKLRMDRVVMGQLMRLMRVSAWTSQAEATATLNHRDLKFLHKKLQAVGYDVLHYVTRRMKGKKPDRNNEYCENSQLLALASHIQYAVPIPPGSNEVSNRRDALVARLLMGELRALQYRRNLGLNASRCTRNNFDDDDDDWRDDDRNRWLRPRDLFDSIQRELMFLATLNETQLGLHETLDVMHSAFRRLNEFLDAFCVSLCIDIVRRHLPSESKARHLLSTQNVEQLLKALHGGTPDTVELLLPLITLPPHEIRFREEDDELVSSVLASIHRATQYMGKPDPTSARPFILEPERTDTDPLIKTPPQQPLESYSFASKCLTLLGHKENKVNIGAFMYARSQQVQDLARLVAGLPPTRLLFPSYSRAQERRRKIASVPSAHIARVLAESTGEDIPSAETEASGARIPGTELSVDREEISRRVPNLRRFLHITSDLFNEEEIYDTRGRAESDYRSIEVAPRKRREKRRKQRHEPEEVKPQEESKPQEERETHSEMQEQTEKAETTVEHETSVDTPTTDTERRRDDSWRQRTPDEWRQVFTRIADAEGIAPQLKAIARSLLSAADDKLLEWTATIPLACTAETALHHLRQCRLQSDVPEPEPLLTKEVRKLLLSLKPRNRPEGAALRHLTRHGSEQDFQQVAQWLLEQRRQGPVDRRDILDYIRTEHAAHSAE